jgi:predicted amidophosphoribosyltransferase
LFRGKKVILVDDVITRGRTFVQTADKLIANGASSVEGMFVAKTVNPDWNSMVA